MPQITILAFFAFYLCMSNTAFSLETTDSNSVYFKSQRFLAQGNHAFYKYGNVKPRDIEDAFCVFLTGDSARLEHFKNQEIDKAVSYALNRENKIMRYDWGCESFRGFSTHIILHYDLWAPSLQYNLAVRCFHFWMNHDIPPFEEIASHLSKVKKKENKEWKLRYREFTKYANNEQLKGKTKRKHQRFLRKSRACML